MNFQVSKLVLEKTGEPEINCQHSLDRKSKRVPEKHLYLIYWLCQGLGLCGSQSVQFCCSVVSDSLQPHENQNARLPCPWPTPGAYPNSCLLSQWFHPTISSSVVPFPSYTQSFSASGSFQMSQFFTSGSKNIGVSSSTSVLPMNTQDCFPLGGTGWISLQPKRLSRVFSNNTVQKHQFFSTQVFYSPTVTSIPDCWKNHRLVRWTFVGKVMSLLFNMLSRLVITFLPKSKHLLISWL